MSPAELSEFHEFCHWVGPRLEANPSLSQSARDRICVENIKRRAQWAESTFLAYSEITIPGGFSKTMLSDLGIVGQTGLLLILVWGFFAMRRETHAIAAFVDRDENSKRVSAWDPSEYTLIPQNECLSAEHYAYAYQSVSQRFMFVFTSYSRPLLGITMVLAAIPALVPGYNLFTDLRDLWDNLREVEPPLFVKTGVELVLYFVLLTVVRSQLTYIARTSTLLNGWNLAVRDVWMGEWDETDDRPASHVEIDVRNQKAQAVKPPAA